MNKVKNIAIITSVLSIIFLIAFFSVQAGLFGPIGEDTRFLGKIYLILTNSEDKYATTSSLEPVGAIVWDFRGIDTFFETVVFAVAIVAIFSMYGEYRESYHSIRKFSSLTVVVRMITLLLLPLMLTVSLSIAFHGSVSPGGGFQAGAIAAVSMLLFLLVFPERFTSDSRINKLFSMMLVGLIGIAIVGFTPVIYAFLTGEPSFFMQNQMKQGSAFSFPGVIYDFPAGGSILFFNMFEYITVGTGFFVVFFLLVALEEVKTVEDMEEGRK